MNIWFTCFVKFSCTIPRAIPDWFDTPIRLKPRSRSFERVVISGKDLQILHSAEVVGIPAERTIAVKKYRPPCEGQFVSRPNRPRQK